MFLFWFLVVLSVYFEIFCYKICLRVEKMWLKKMCKICRKIAFSKCYQTPEIIFWTIFHCKIKNPDFIFLTKIHFPLHSFYTRNSIYIKPKAGLKANLTMSLVKMAFLLPGTRVFPIICYYMICLELTYSTLNGSLSFLLKKIFFLF